MDNTVINKTKSQPRTSRKGFCFIKIVVTKVVIKRTNDKYYCKSVLKTFRKIYVLILTISTNS